MNNENAEINKKQKDFYDNKNKNLATRVWSKIRNGLLTNIRKVMGFEKQIIEEHLSWMGDVSNKKVLDLGCYEGNPLSIHLARNSKRYIAIDLSDKGISHLKNRIQKFPNAHANVMDFLSDNFEEKDFDLIYAYGVLHHFKNTPQIINKLQEKLAPHGEIISYDPLETNTPLKIMRSLYRPFQTDKEWEWPFTRKTYFQYADAFHIKERRGMLGKAKWYFLLNFLPLGAEKKVAIGQKWHTEDWKKSQNSEAHLFNCMHLTMLMQKRD